MFDDDYLRHLMILSNFLSESLVSPTIKEPFKMYSETKKIFDKDFSVSFKYTPPLKKESRTFSISKEGKKIKGLVTILNHNESKKTIKMGFEFDIDIFLDKGSLVVSKSNIRIKNGVVFSFMFGGLFLNIPSLSFIRKNSLFERLMKRGKYTEYRMYLHEKAETLYMTESSIFNKVDNKIFEEIDESFFVKKFYRCRDISLSSSEGHVNMFSILYLLCALQLIVRDKYKTL